MELNFCQDSEPFFKYLTIILTSKGLVLGIRSCKYIFSPEAKKNTWIVDIAYLKNTIFLKLDDRF